MKNKGFTLIELLGVIIILSLLTILVFPNIINSVKNSTDKTDKLTMNLINNASELYISNHLDDFPKDDGNKFSIELSELVAEGLLVSPIKYGKDNDITNKKCVQVTYNNENFNYELKNTGECEVKTYKICKLQEGSSEAVGSKYICKLDEERIFYVLENNESSDDISLIMDRNIGDPVAWCGDETLCKTDGNWDNKKGPITANAYLASQTSTWEVTTMLPSNEQIVAIGCSEGSCPTWLYDYLRDTEHPVSNMYGYWMISPSPYDSSHAYTVYYEGYRLTQCPILNNTIYGVRPVITIPKDRLY